MNDAEVRKLAGMMSKIAYELHDKEYINKELREMLLDLWREFYYYEESND